MDDHRHQRFVEADFTGTIFHGVNFSNVKISDAWLANVDVSGMVAGLSVNGVDVTRYVERVLDERHPERTLLAPVDPDGMRAAWQVIETFAGATLERAGRLPPDRLDQSVDDEWSYLETMRHLVFATDRWLNGPVFRDPEPFHPLGMPNPNMDAVPAGIFDLDAKPTLEEVVTVRRGRMDRIAEYLAA